MTAPTLTTQRLTLKALNKASRQQVEWLHNPDVVRYSEQRHKEHSLSAQQKYINSFSGFLWGIYHVEDGIHMGNLSAMTDPYNNTADVGILLGYNEIWRKGYGTEAWQAATNWLLEANGGKFRKLEAGCAACNLGMKRILEKTGFVFEGEKKNSLLIDHSPCGVLFYGRFK